MSTLNDHQSSADLAREALRALAHATVRFDRPDDDCGAGPGPEHPQDTYWALGDVLAMVRSLSQVAQQIGAAHDRNADRACVGDDPASGRAAVANVHAGVRDALLALERAHESLNTAMSESSKITWLPPATPPQLAARPTLASLPPTSAHPTGPRGPGL